MRVSLAGAKKLLRGSTFADVDAGVAMLKALGGTAFADALLDGKHFLAGPRESRPMRAHALRAVLAADPALRGRERTVRVEAHHGPWGRDLGVRTTGAQPMTLSPLASFSALERLVVHGVKKLTELDALAGLPKLRSLAIAEAGGFTSLAAVGRLPLLEELDLRHVNLTTLDLRAFPALRRLRLCFTPKLRAVRGLPAGLEELHLNYARLAPTELARARKLRVLTLAPATRPQLAALRSLRALEELVVTADLKGGEELLPPLPRLRALTLYSRDTRLERP